MSAIELLSSLKYIFKVARTSKRRKIASNTRIEQSETNGNTMAPNLPFKVRIGHGIWEAMTYKRNS